MTTTTAAVEWELWSTRARLVVTDPGVLGSARELVDSYLAQVDDAANRFRGDSEICRLAQRSGEVTLSPTLAHLVAEALAAAELTDGDVDPTVGGALRRLGYDRDLRLVTGDAGPLRAVIRPVPGYRSLRLDGSRLAAARRGRAGPRRDRQGGGRGPRRRARARRARHRRAGQPRRRHRHRRGRPGHGGWQVHVQDRDEDPWTPGRAARRLRDRDLQHRLAAVAARRPDAAPHRRPPHRPAGPAGTGAASPWRPTPACTPTRSPPPSLVRGERGRRLGPRPRPAGPVPAPRRRAGAHRRLADGEAA